MEKKEDKKEKDTRSDIMQTSKMFRDFAFNREDVDVEARTVSLAFSSEAPVERWFGDEVLSHDPSEVRMSRLLDGGAVLVDHDAADHVGVVESASIDSDRRGRATVRFGNGARASEVWQDVQDGIRRHISVGYVIHEMRQEDKNNKSGVDVFRAVDWEPLEVSLVSIPADHSVGIFRSESNEDGAIKTTVHRTLPAERQSKKIMSQDNKEGVAPDVAKVAPSPSPDELRGIRADARRDEVERIHSIEALGSQHENKELAREFIGNGNTVDEFKSALLERVGTPVASKQSDTGLNAREVEKFSFRKAINALANPHDRRAQAEAAFEFECSRAASDLAGSESRGLRVPNEVLKRDQTVGTAADGGNLVGEDTSGFIEMLRNTSVAMERGTVLGGLVGNIAIPRQSGGATAYWLAEGGATTENKASFDQVTMTPKTVAAWVDISRKLSQQSSIDVEALIRQDIATTLGLAMDLAAVNGGGTNEPSGILQTSGIGAVAGGTNGGLPTWADIVDLETAVAQDNAVGGNMAYLSNYKASGTLKQTSKVSSTDSIMLLEDGELNGYEFLLSNQVPSDLTKGTGTALSALIFGNFADLMIGLWGGLDLTVDPYSESTKGTIRVVAFQDCDIALRHAESFAAMQDMITS
tara:strand:- start:2876 stop:4795 length:1920 start_codon:yes stop_codon:yes gene_type:complete